MTKLKKLVLSLSLVLVMSVALVVGFVFNKDTTGAEPTSPKYEEVVADNVEVKKPVKLNYEPGEIQFQKGGKQIEYTYNPSVDSAEEEPVIKPVAYEYIFTNTMNGAAAIHLKGIDTTAVNVTYVVRTGSEGPLTKFDSVTSTEDYSIQVLDAKGDKVYIYILVAPTEEFIPVTFTTSVKWYYGIPQQINVVDNVTGEILGTETIVTGQKLDKKSLPTPTKMPAAGYYFDGWFMDPEFTQPINGEYDASRKVYARFANLPSNCMDANRTTVNAGLFELGHRFTNVVVPTGVTTISGYAFFSSGLQNIDLPNTVTTIGANAFDNCLLKNLKIPSSVTNIDRDFLGGISGLTSIIDTLDVSGTGITSIFYNASGSFGIKNIIAKDCKQLTSFIIDENTETIDLSGCTALTSFLTETFQYHKKLRDVNLSGSGIITINAEAFDGCTALTRVNLKDCDSLVTIGSHAFACCESLQSIIIPKNVTSLSEYAFFGCFNLSIIYNLSSVSIGANTEYLPSGLIIYKQLPAGYQG